MNDYGTDEQNPSGFDDRGRWFDAARASVRGPGTWLQWFGLFSLILAVISIALVLVSPDTIFRAGYDFQVELNKNQPPEDRRRIPAYDDYVKEQTNYSLIVGVLQMFGSLVIFYGGMQIKDLNGYGLGIVASLLAIVPCNSCCCIGLPIGAWTLVNLLGSDVKLAFARARGTTPLE